MGARLGGVVDGTHNAIADGAMDDCDGAEAEAAGGRVSTEAYEKAALEALLKRKAKDDKAPVLKRPAGASDGGEAVMKKPAASSGDGEWEVRRYHRSKGPDYFMWRSPDGTWFRTKHEAIANGYAA